MSHKDHCALCHVRGPSSLFAVLAILLAGLALPQAATAAWDTFRPQDGLPGYVVYSVLEARDGALWIGGIGGAARYDGVTLRTEFSGPTVRDIIQDRDGALWFATDNGVTRYDGVSWASYNDGLFSLDVRALLQDHIGRLWAGGQGGTATLNEDRTWTIQTGGDSQDLFEDSHHRIWSTSEGGGIGFFDGVQWSGFTAATGLPDNYCYGVTEDRNGIVWVGTRAGAARFDGTSWTLLPTSTQPAYATVRCLREDRDGFMWLGTYLGGLHRYDGRNLRQYTQKDGLAGNAVYALFEDRHGNLWVGSDHGLTRYDRSDWDVFTTADGLAQNWTTGILIDRAGDHWFSSSTMGLARFDGAAWRTYTIDDGLAGNSVIAMCQDSSGIYWFACMKAGGVDGRGVSRFDGTTWRTVNKADGLADSLVFSIVQDRQGALWFGTRRGASRFDGTTWRTFTSADGLAVDQVNRIFVDSRGDLWFACYVWGTEYRGGLTRFDGTSWRTYRTSDGLLNDVVLCMAEDQQGGLWFGSPNGLTRFDGTSWHPYSLAPSGAVDVLVDRSNHIWAASTTGARHYDWTRWDVFGWSDGLANDAVRDIAEDPDGTLWFATYDGVTRHRPDHVPPWPIVAPSPAAVSLSRDINLTFQAAFREARDVWFSWSLDHASWSAWASVPFAQLQDVPDGPHTFAVRARDKTGNADTAVVDFEIDTTPPAPLLVYPRFGDAVRDTVVVLGSATDVRFRDYSVRVIGKEGQWEGWTEIQSSPSAVSQGALATWNTRSFPDGLYALQVVLTDTLGVSGSTTIDVIVDNAPPWATQTTPALVRATVGGHVYTTTGTAHLYFPPNALTRDAVVRLTPVAEADVPAQLPDGAERLLPGYEISLGGAGLAGKVAMLELSCSDTTLHPPVGAPVIYRQTEAGDWVRVGGTVDVPGRWIRAPVETPGRYALYAGGVDVVGPRSLFALSATPRVFSPRGTFANTEVAIGFSLGQAATVTVKVHNRAGRLVRELASGWSLGAGANVVRWDGRDRDGVVVEDGLYLVTVEALGQAETRTLAVVR